MKKEVKPIDYNLELKASLVLFAVSILIVIICVVVRWDEWVVVINRVMNYKG